MDVKLKVINRSLGAHQSNIVLFQNNLLSDLNELPVAWKVIRYCGYDCYHPVVYPSEFEVALSDEFGNYSPRLPISGGHALGVTLTPSGRRLTDWGRTAQSDTFEVLNEMLRGSVNINVYKAGLLLARKTAVAPGQKATFRFTPAIWVGVVSEVEQSQTISSAIVQAVNVNFVLIGFCSADLVVTGGGADRFQFALENIGGPLEAHSASVAHANGSSDASVHLTQYQQGESDMDIKLNLINNSNDANNSQIVIFQKNVAANFNELAVAWRVIEYLGQGDNHPFTFPMSMAVSASDSYQNWTPQFAAQNGQQFSMNLTNSGHQLVASGSGTSPTEVQVLNNLPQGAINASIVKGGKVLATKTSIAPQQKAVFQFKPTIWIGVASQVVEGEVMNSAIITAVNTELSLLGIAKADIVMTGGGPGRNSTAFQFALQNVQMS
jgi:hypothetical protein